MGTARALVVGRGEIPVDHFGRLTAADEQVGDPPVHPSPRRRRLHLVRHFAQQLVTESQHVLVALARHQDAVGDQCVQLALEIGRFDVEQGRQHLAVDVPPHRGRGGDDDDPRVRRRQPREERLVERVGDAVAARPDFIGPARLPAAHELFHVQRDPVAALRNGSPLGLGQPECVDRVDQLEPIGVAERPDLEDGVRRQPTAGT